jgi:putative ABC transport system permease protein
VTNLPEWEQVVRKRLSRLGHGDPDDTVVEELALHLSETYEEARRNGDTEQQAAQRTYAVLDAGDLFRQTMAARPPQRKRAWMTSTSLIGDIRFALRMLIRAPGFSLVAILTFAVGIGVNTAVFNVVNGVLLRPLPYPDADRITMLWMDNRRQSIREDITSYPNYLDWRNQNTSYEHVAGFTPTALSLTGSGEPERLIGASVTANFFDVLRVSPQLGRVFTADNETPGQDTVVVISHGLWQRRFGGATDVLGKTMTLSGRSYEVIGVMPSTLRWPENAELWRPLAPTPQLRDARGSFWLPVIGRLKPGIPLEQAQTEMSEIGRRLEEEYPLSRGYGVYVVSLQDQLVGNIERALLVLLGSVGFVLLIACANLANLTLARTAARRKELAIRAALGAARGRLIGQIVTETFVLALIGAGLGVGLAYWATAFFLSLGGDSIPRQEAVSMDARVLGFALTLATVSAVLAGLIPAVQASRRKIVDHLREGTRAGSGVTSRRTRNALVAAEVALAVVLLTGAGLLIRTLWTMQRAERGFDASNVAMMTVSVPPASYAAPTDVRSFYIRLLERVRAVPGVTSAATGTGVLQPLVTNSGVYSIEGRPLPPPEERVEYPLEIVSPGYFETVGMQILRGRGFTEADHADATPAVIVNETFARQAWPEQNPLGRRIRSGDDSSQAPWLTVVGVIRDAHRSEVTRAIRPEIYLSALQSTPRTQTLLMRTAVEPTAVIQSVRRELQALDPQLPAFNVTTLEAELQSTLNQPRFQAVLLAVFAGLALLLATIGIYGVTATAVSQRTQEVGIRMAMGAARSDVLRMMLLQHLRPALIGLLGGMLGALALSRFLRSLLFGVSATDPFTFAIGAAILLTVAAAACFAPARRATRVDPMMALRNE